MAHAAGLRCIRCGTSFPLAHYAMDCPSCKAAGVPANLTVRYDTAAGAGAQRAAAPHGSQSMWRYDAFLPASVTEAVSLGEGLTPLIELPKLGLGRVYMKDESRNPTWSFKDRLASSAVTMARKLGAKVIASSSSGNAGAATAAYAAKAGLPCVIITFASAAGPMVTQMRAYGAMLLTVENKDDRWRLLSAAVREYGWFPTTVYFGPAVGSNPLGVEGYKTISIEIAASLDWRAPDWCVLPVCYGDAIYGMWKGFTELKALGWIDRVPRFVAAEVSGSIVAAMRDNIETPPVTAPAAPSLAGSIGATQGTYQSVKVLRETGGHAVFVEDERLMHWQSRLAREEGLYVEPSSAAPFHAIEHLRVTGTIGANDVVVALNTAGGLKDPASTEALLGAAPKVGGSLKDLAGALQQHYGFKP